jgi:hypothetical protein
VQRVDQMLLIGFQKVGDRQRHKLLGDSEAMITMSG